MRSFTMGKGKNTRPEKRMDKNGKLVTRHINNEKPSRAAESEHVKDHKNDFASSLLMPESLLKEALKKHKEYYTKNATMFNISPKTIEMRAQMTA